jgi:hypothetical protein
MLDESMGNMLIDGGTLYGAPIKVSNQRSILNQNETRKDDDMEVWNMRLMMSINYLVVFMSDINGNGGDNPDGLRVVQRYLDDDVFTPNIWSGFATAASNWMSRTLTDGLQLFAVTAAANWPPISRILFNMSKAAIEIWAVNGLISSTGLLLGASPEIQSEWITMLRSKKGKDTAPAMKEQTSGGLVVVVAKPVPTDQTGTA